MSLRCGDFYIFCNVYLAFFSGETSSGKSSLLNLIIGEKVLPEHLLSSTACICRIYNSVEKYAIAIDENGPTHIDIVTDIKLKEYVCVNKNTQTSHYKGVDIFWPIPMLKVQSILFPSFVNCVLVRVYMYVTYLYGIAVIIRNTRINLNELTWILIILTIG